MRLAVFLTLFGVFLTASRGGGGELDGMVMYGVARSLVSRGALDVPDAPGLGVVHPGPDGKLYAQYAPLPSVAYLPAAFVEKLSGEPGYGLLAARATTAALAAWLALLFFELVRRRGTSVAAASATTLGLVLGTQLFVYGRMMFSEVLQALCLLALLDAWWRWQAAASRRRALWLGASAGLLFLSKAAFAVTIATGAAVLLYRHAKDPERRRSLALAAAAALPALVLMLGYDLARFGDPLNTGYGSTLAGFRENPLVGLWGLFFSPGRGLFPFNPLAVLVPFGIAQLLRKHRRDAWTLLALVLPPLLLVACFLSWSGDWAWGPRYLTPLLPALFVPVAPVVQRVLDGSRAKRIALASLFTVSFGVQLLGAAFEPVSTIAMTIDAHDQWLGKPDRSGARSGEQLGDRCGWCFEDTHSVQWLPPFQQLRLHWWLLRHVPFGDPWSGAARDAPWVAYTTKPIDVSARYAALRLDWLPEQPGLVPGGRWGARWPVALGLALALWGALRWRRSARGDA